MTERARVFSGVPYAAPPVGPRRWRPPQPPTPWSPAIIQAVNDPPGCPQICSPHLESSAGADPNPGVYDHRTCPSTTSEDCLFLSVYTPRLGNFSEPAQVMLYVPGGGGGRGGARRSMDALAPVRASGCRFLRVDGRRHPDCCGV